MKLELCENTGFRLRMALMGPSGSGKTYSALKIATALGFEKVAIIDTENMSARRYARSFPRRFSSLELTTFSPQDYQQAIDICAKAGIEVLVIDSLTHAWSGKGGVLEMVDHAARRQKGGSSFNAWRDVTPEHNGLVNALIQAPMHLIVTMRVKTEYVVETNEKGKSTPRKVGLAPVQRDGLEYEFDVVGEMTPEHDLIITKSRCTPLADAVISKPGEQVAQTLRSWVDGVAAAPPRPEAEARQAEARQAAPRQTALQQFEAKLAGCASEEEVKAVLDKFNGWLEEQAERPNRATEAAQAQRLAAHRVLKLEEAAQLRAQESRR